MVVRGKINGDCPYFPYFPIFFGIDIANHTENLDGGFTRITLTRRRVERGKLALEVVSTMMASPREFAFNNIAALDKNVRARCMIVVQSRAVTMGFSPTEEVYPAVAGKTVSEVLNEIIRSNGTYKSGCQPIATLIMLYGLSFTGDVSFYRRVASMDDILSEDPKSLSLWDVKTAKRKAGDETDLVPGERVWIAQKDYAAEVEKDMLLGLDWSKRDVPEVDRDKVPLGQEGENIIYLGNNLFLGVGLEGSLVTKDYAYFKDEVEKTFKTKAPSVLWSERWIPTVGLQTGSGAIK